MNHDLQLNVSLLKKRVPNLTIAARAAGLRPATVSNLCTGKIPVGGAELRTLAILASIAGCTIDELIIRRSAIKMIETGIKVVDLFAPFVRGGTMGFVARPMTGQLVLLAELCRRMRQRGFVTVFWMPKEETLETSEVAAEVENTCKTFNEVYNYITSIQGDRDILLSMDRAMVLSGDLLKLRDRLQEAGTQPITVALVDTRGEAVDEDAPYGPLETLWQFDTDLKSRHIYPPISPIFSTSTILEGVQLEASHLTIQQQARKLLRRYRELRSIVNALGIESLTIADLDIYQRGVKLEAFFAQPFFVAEPFTKRPGEWIPLQETLNGVFKIMGEVGH